MENGIEADLFCQCPGGILPEPGQQVLLVVFQESIYDLIGKAYKAINIADGMAEVGMQQPDRRIERCAVRC